MSKQLFSLDYQIKFIIENTLHIIVITPNLNNNRQQPTPYQIVPDKPLLLIDYELKQYKHFKRHHASVNSNLKIQLSDVQEGSTSVLSNELKTIFSDDLSISTDNSTSTNVFWDQSEVKDVKMLYVSGSNGKRSVQEVTISTGITAVERSQDDLDIYDLLF
ncbi:Hypothetical_protein [Hexamita inflata]|uniref:Hypothetical_protein n=1 Tax=Hexamita inflata TaxID=28002 RepID=A0AA86UWN2_9EUKA|nr:Hypothetical protein HINF_LOCUS55322 [Hexamita inflata]CAI9967679.1 Hypothetical protein HINF_LOCUS55324 [Hexamita inflata]